MQTIQILKYTVYAAEVLSALAGFIYWHKIKNSYWKRFPVYLLLIAVTEITNQIAMTIFKWSFIELVIFQWIIVPIEFLFLTWLFLKAFKSKTGRLLCYTSCFLTVAGLVADALFFSGSGTWAFLSFSYTVSSLALLVLITYYIIQFAQSDEILKWRSNMMFWVVTGLTLFYLGTFPYFGLFNTLYKNHYSLFYIYSITTLVLDFIMYAFFTVSFICGKPKK